MNQTVFLIGMFLNILGAALSFSPLFQDFDETGLSISFEKSDDFPNSRDLLMANVHFDCQLSENAFSGVVINGDLMCDTASKWLSVLIGLILVGIFTMFVGAVMGIKKTVSKIED